MDYLTKSVSRFLLREFSKELRTIFGIPLSGKFPVIWALEIFPEIFPGSIVTIASDNELPATIPARCNVNADGTFEIEIRQTTYDGAYHKEIGAFLDHILHEICHAFLYSRGYTPIVLRSFSNKSIPSYCSAEWQAKALCGEVMMPYEETKNMTPEEIEKKYSVSPSQAKYRLKY